MRTLLTIPRSWISAATALGLAAAWTSVATAQCYHPADHTDFGLLGDINSSGTTNVADTVCALLVVMWEQGGGTGMLPGCLAGDWWGSDLNCSGGVDVSDAQLHISVVIRGELGSAVDGDNDGCADACVDCSQGGSSCLIAGACVPEDDENPGQECEFCRPSADPLDWSAGIDGDACNGASGQVCQVGACVVTVPGAPTGVSAIALDDTAQVSFTAPANTGGSPITGYTAQCTSSTGGATGSASDAQSPIDVSALTGGHTYTCTVTAQNSAGSGPPSAPSNSIQTDLGIWEAAGAFLVLTKNDATYFSAQDCDTNFFGTNQTTVNGVPFRVGPHTGSNSRMAGLPQGGISIPTPGSDLALDSVHMIFPGGRCSGQNLSVRFDYIDATTNTVTMYVAHDCGAGPGSGTNYDLIHQGGYSPAQCCNHWYRGQFYNPAPAKNVASVRVTYSDGCGGSYPGQMWAITLEPE